MFRLRALIGCLVLALATTACFRFSAGSPCPPDERQLSFAIDVEAPDGSIERCYEQAWDVPETGGFDERGEELNEGCFDDFGMGLSGGSSSSNDGVVELQWSAKGGKTAGDHGGGIGFGCGAVQDVVVTITSDDNWTVEVNGA